MESNPYSPPQSDLESPGSVPLFYIVSVRKFTILFFATLGMYSIYWFFKNWFLYKCETGEKIWPVPRALFSIFFAHSLFSKIQDKLAHGGIRFPWNPSTMATLYVVVSISSNILERMAEKEIWSPYSDVLSFMILPVLYFTLLVPQKAINHAEQDPEGSSNSRLTFANYIWIALGLALWGVGILGFLVIFDVITI